MNLDVFTKAEILCNQFKIIPRAYKPSLYVARIKLPPPINKNCSYHRRAGFNKNPNSRNCKEIGKSMCSAGLAKFELFASTDESAQNIEYYVEPNYKLKGMELSRLCIYCHWILARLR
jgi:hypothetical protein